MGGRRPVLLQYRDAPQQRDFTQDLPNEGFAQRDFIELLVSERKLTDPKRLVPHPDYHSPRPISAFGVAFH